VATETQFRALAGVQRQYPAVRHTPRIERLLRVAGDGPDLIVTTTVGTGNNMKRYHAAGMPDLFKLLRVQADEPITRYARPSPRTFLGPKHR
jgi:hypothetical protein